MIPCSDACPNSSREIKCTFLENSWVETLSALTAQQTLQNTVDVLEVMQV